MLQIIEIKIIRTLILLLSYWIVTMTTSITAATDDEWDLYIMKDIGSPLDRLAD